MDPNNTDYIICGAVFLFRDLKNTVFICFNILCGERYRPGILLKHAVQLLIMTPSQMLYGLTVKVPGI